MSGYNSNSRRIRTESSMDPDQNSRSNEPYHLWHEANDHPDPRLKERQQYDSLMQEWKSQIEEKKLRKPTHITIIPNPHPQLPPPPHPFPTHSIPNPKPAIHPKPKPRPKPSTHHQHSDPKNPTPEFQTTFRTHKNFLNHYPKPSNPQPSTHFPPTPRQQH
jgi:hypothetical protein